MRAEEARKQTQRAITKQRADEIAKKKAEEHALQNAQARGRQEYEKYLKKTLKEIEAAAAKGERHVEVGLNEPFTETSPYTDAYYLGVQKKVKAALERRGYTVKTSQSVDVHRPFGSDPMFDRTMHWLRVRVQVEW